MKLDEFSALFKGRFFRYGLLAVCIGVTLFFSYSLFQTSQDRGGTASHLHTGGLTAEDVERLARERAATDFPGVIASLKARATTLGMVDSVPCNDFNAFTASAAQALGWESVNRCDPEQVVWIVDMTGDLQFLDVGPASRIILYYFPDGSLIGAFSEP